RSARSSCSTTAMPPIRTASPARSGRPRTPAPPPCRSLSTAPSVSPTRASSCAAPAVRCRQPRHEAPVHVGYVLKKFPRNSETFILNEILALQRAGVDVTVFSLFKPDDGVYHRALADLRRPVIYLPSRRADAWLEHLRQHLPLLQRSAARLWGD